MAATSGLRIFVAVNALFLLVALSHGVANDDDYAEGAGDREMLEMREPMEEISRSAYLLRAVKSVDSFINLLYKENGERLTPSDIFSEYQSEDGGRVLRSGGRIAEPDVCSPRPTTVNLQVNDLDSREIYYPRCAKVERCGGCGSKPYLKCLPTSREKVTVNVVKAKTVRPGSPHLLFTGLAPVAVERHLRCTTRCTLSRARCGRKKQFLPNQCECRCRQYRSCTAPQVFNADTCECECPGGASKKCCDWRVGEECGFFFNKRSCLCEAHSGARKLSKDSSKKLSSPLGPQTGRIHISSKHEDHGDSAPTLHADDLDLDPAYEAVLSAVQSSPCSYVRCPRSFRQVVYGDVCRCRPIGRFRRPRRKSKSKAKQQ